MSFVVLCQNFKKKKPNGSKNTMTLFSESNSEHIYKHANNGAFKEYEFEPSAAPDVEEKISQFWKMTEVSNLKPRRPKKKYREGQGGNTRKDGEEEVEKEKDKEEISWYNTWTMLMEKGLEKDARAAKNEYCKICSNNDMGKEFADEVYEDRYIKKMGPVQYCE